ncbi:aldo/keto reductase [Nocardia sp. NPDC052566]|uniref:aldo/keto reductase n=1 Tax=Nocardia sp. NPDC052566 TaxID=3364330 RepID=UPI0037CAC14F
MGRTPSQVALAWALRQRGITSPIIGARTPAQLEDNLGALEVEFDDQHLARLAQASSIDLGFPHEFLGRAMTQSVTFGDLKIEGRR